MFFFFNFKLKMVPYVWSRRQLINDISTFVGYSMPNPPLEKNSSSTI